jgi:hypothetical protein
VTRKRQRAKGPDRTEALPPPPVPPARPRDGGNAVWIPRSLFAAPLLLAGLLGVHTLTSIYQDIGRHLTLGKIIWETKQIPATNLFSYTHPDFPFANHHWLAEVLLYAGDRLIGLHGLIVLKALLLVAAFGLAYAACWRHRSSATAAIIAVIAVLVAMDRTDVRPEILSFLFVGWFLFVLYRRPALVWTLPVVQAIWVNTHIYFFMGPLLWVCWLAGEIARDGRAGVSRKTLLVTGLLAAATLCNPRFLAGALYPLHVLDNYGNMVVENQSPAFLRANGYRQFTTIMLYVGMAVTALGFAVNRKNIRRNVFGLLGAAVTAVFALMMVRNFPLFALVMLPAGVRNFDEAGRFFPSLQIPALAGTIVLLLLVVSGQLYAWAGSGRSFGVIVPGGYQRAIDHFRSAGFKGPVFNNFDIGSYLIWKLPEERVFVDGRPEAYPAEFFRNVYVPMQEDSAAWARESERFRLNAIIWNTRDVAVSAEKFLARIMKDSAWVPMFFGDRILIMLRNNEANRDVISRHPAVNLDRR